MHVKRGKMAALLAATAGVMVILSACGQPDILSTPDLDPTRTAPSSPIPVTREACGDPATRTPVPTYTPLPTGDPRMPTPEPTSTANADRWISLYWPPNCAVLHSGDFPNFGFDHGGPFGLTLYLDSPDTGVNLAIPEHELAETAMTLPDGMYYWSVSGSRLSGARARSYIWEFWIDTTCNCTDTPTPDSTG